MLCCILIIMFSRGLLRLGGMFRKAKRVINIPRAKLEEVEEMKHVVEVGEDVFIDTRKLGWENMDLSELSSLDPKKIEEIKYSIKKFKGNASIPNTLSETQEGKLKDHLQSPYTYLTNRKSHPLIQPKSIIQLYDFNLGVSNEPLVSLIETVFKNIHRPTTLYGKVETSFIQYITGLINDLKRVGKDLESLNVKVEELRPVEIKYQFCVDVSKNRSKNEGIQKYIITQETILNPNTSLLMRQHHNKEITFQSIIKKRRSDNYKSVLRVNSLLEVILRDGKRHYVKVEWEGPQTRSTLNVEYPETPQYQIIDIDGVMKGNPSIKSPFVFN